MVKGSLTTYGFDVLKIGSCRQCVIFQLAVARASLQPRAICWHPLSLQCAAHGAARPTTRGIAQRLR